LEQIVANPFEPSVSDTEVVTATLDITAPKQEAESLGTSEERFRRYFELGLIGMAITSPDKGCIEANDEICKILGYDRSELMKMTWAEMTHPDDLPADVAKFERVLAKEIDGYTLDKRWIRKDGQVIHSTISVKCVRREDGAVDYFVAMLQDFTARRQAEEALAKSHANLERRVADRTQQLTVINEELRNKETELQLLTARIIEMQEMENKYLARELHDDFSQKLAVLGMEIAAVAQRESSFEMRGRLQGFTAQIGTLAKDIHRISRQLHSAILDDLGLAAALRNECGGFSEQHGIPVEFDHGDVPSVVPGDISLCLYRVAQECLRNIGKHANATRARVALRRVRDELAMEITDSGDGFDPQAIKGKGGLGLISMEERIRMVRGTLSISSQPRKGTVVEARVPFPRGHA
jgi:PAS domain S-box-containing protein